MARRRFYAAPESIEMDKGSATLSPEETRHLRDVLRLKAGDPARVFDGQGHEYECVVSEVKRNSAHLTIEAAVSPTCAESPLALTLAVALLKHEKFDLVVQKSTELGVKTIVPVITALADVRLRDTSDAQNRIARWGRIALEAAKQSGRALVPKVANPTELASLLQMKSLAEETCLMFSERMGQSFDETMANSPQTTAVTALVGSEGGWSDEELSLARASEWQIITLGGRILRAETAAITICALLQHRFGDLS